MLHKQVIIGLLASPVLIGIPLIEMCLLIREERLGQFLSLLQKTAPILVLCFIPTLLILPRVETLWGCLVVGLIGGLFGSWGRRMIDLGLFGDPSEYADLV